MLKYEVVQSVVAGKFHIYPASTIGEGMEIHSRRLHSKPLPAVGAESILSGDITAAGRTPFRRIVDYFLPRLHTADKKKEHILAFPPAHQLRTCRRNSP